MLVILLQSFTIVSFFRLYILFNEKSNQKEVFVSLEQNVMASVKETYQVLVHAVKMLTENSTPHMEVACAIWQCNLKIYI